MVLGVVLCAAHAKAANIVVNPGFELGLSNWTVGNDSWFIDTIPHSGSNDITTSCAGAGCLDPVNGAFFFQNLSTVIGQSYDLSFWGFFEGAPDEIKVTWGGVTVVDIVNPAIPDDVYTQFSALNLLATSSTTRLQFFGRSDPGFNAVDDISVTQSVPEPSVLVLIGTGLLVIAGYRLRRRPAPILTPDDSRLRSQLD